MATLTQLKERTQSGSGKKFIFDTPLTMQFAKDLETTRVNGKRHYVTPEGRVYPSVTTFLKHFDDGEWKKEWIAKVGVDAAQAESLRCTTRGTAIHLALEKYLLNEENPERHAGQYRRMFNQIRRVLARRVTKVVCLEHALYSDILKIAGRVDMIGYWDGVLSVIDFKNSNRMKKKENVEDYFLQVASYSVMFQERYGLAPKQLVILNSTETGEKQDCQILIAQRDEYIPILKQRIIDYRKDNDYDLIPSATYLRENNLISND